MAQFGSIPSSQVTRYGRMDASFHLAISEIAEELASFEEKGISKEVCIAQLKALPMFALEPLKVLQRGNTKRAIFREEADRLIEAYPYEAWLIVRKEAHKARDALTRKEVAIAEQRKALSRFF